MEPYGCRPRAPTPDSISRRRVVEVATPLGLPLAALSPVAVAALAGPLDLGRGPIQTGQHLTGRPGHSCSPAGAPAAQIIHAYTLLQDKEALSETGANVRWLIAVGIRDFQAMLEELHKLQSDLPRDAPAPDEPTPDD
jgi:hypothetical protein